MGGCDGTAPESFSTHSRKAAQPSYQDQQRVAKKGQLKANLTETDAQVLNQIVANGNAALQRGADRR